MTDRRTMQASPRPASVPWGLGRAGAGGSWPVAIISLLSLAMVSCRGPGSATPAAETDGVLSIKGSYANNSIDVSHRKFKLTG